MSPTVIGNRRRIALGITALGILVGMLLWGAPATQRLDSGSTWYRGPGGYSAWYEFLEQQGITVQRWQQPISALLEAVDTSAPLPPAPPPKPQAPQTGTLIQATHPGPETLVAILPGFTDPMTLPGLLPWMADWLEAGHRLVVLGWHAPATAAPFSQRIAHDRGLVQVDSRRRHPATPDQTVFLADSYGAVAWEDRSLDAGPVMAIATPHLGANAYLGQPGNFAFLTDLVAGAGGRVWIDEYLHGYRDGATVEAEVGSDSWLAYLARTPLLILGLQALGVTLLALIAFNHRLGPRRRWNAPPVDNSQAYIHALAGVLRKANSHDFVLHSLSQAERMALQRRLGLGSIPLPIDQLQAAWEQQMGHPAPNLADLLTPPTPSSDTQLRDWLQRVQSLQPLSPGDPNQP